MSSFALYSLAIRSNEFASHHPKTSETLSEDITLNISVVILARPDEAPGGFDYLYV